MMEERTIEGTEELAVDLKRLFAAVWRRIWIVILVAVLTAALALGATYFFITPQYQSSAIFYVNNKSRPAADAAASITSGDLSTSRNLVESCIVILNTRESLQAVIDYTGINRTCEDLEKMITAGAVNQTEMFEVVVTSTDPLEAERIINAISYILPDRISDIIDGTSAKIVDTAVIPSKPSSPRYPVNIAIGFLVGFMLTICVIVLREVFDITIRTEEDVAQSCKYPILAVVPDMAAPGKGSSYYCSNSKQPQGQGRVIGSDISVTASEAYKMLRTKLQFSFVGDSNCRVIGVSSSLSGEGKSLTAVNLAHTMAQLDQRIILLDCDMRCPTLTEEPDVLKTPGLSDCLTGKRQLDDLLQQCNQKDDKRICHIITAGQHDSNSVELLSSARMKAVLKALRKHYDYVILDLPPVGEVTDAMAMVHETDGMLLVVRENYCDRVILAETIGHLEFLNARVLGVVVNCAVAPARTHCRNYRKYHQKHSCNYANDHYAGQKPKGAALTISGTDDYR